MILQDPEMKFAFCLSCNEEPKELINRVSAEWEKLGDTRLFSQKLSAFKTTTPVVIYHMLNSAHPLTFLSEIVPIISTAHQELK